MGPVVDRAGLEVRLVLHRSGQAGVVDVDEGGHELAGALLPRVDPLPPPGAVQLLGDPGEGGADERTVVVRLDLVGVRREEGPQVGDVALGDVAGVAGEEAAELEEAALGAEEHLLRDGGAGDPPGRVAEVLAQQLGLGEQRLAEHVARGEAVHRVGDRDQRERRRAVRDGREVRGLLRVGPEEDRVPGAEQGVDVVVPRHDVEGVLGHHACGDLEDEAPDLLAHRDVVGLHRVEDPLARGRVGDVLPAGERGAERAALGGVLALRLEEEGVPAPDVALALGPGGLVELGDLRRRRDRVADDTAADVAHHVGDGSVAVDDGRGARVPRRRAQDRGGIGGLVEVREEPVDPELGRHEGPVVARGVGPGAGADCLDGGPLVEGAVWGGGLAAHGAPVVSTTVSRVRTRPVARQPLQPSGRPGCMASLWTPPVCVRGRPLHRPNGCEPRLGPAGRPRRQRTRRPYISPSGSAMSSIRAPLGSRR